MVTEQIPLLPALDARALDGTNYRLPNDLGAARNIVAVAFQKHQQSDVDSWLDDFARLEAEHADLISYEMPTMSRRWGPARSFIDGGMTAAIPDPKARARTITVYTDVGRVLDSLGLPDTEEIAVILCDRDGVVEWMERGERTEAAAASLRAALTDGR